MSSLHSPGSLGSAASPPEVEGSETQSMAYTTDNGTSWKKLLFGASGNPIIYDWPTGFSGLTGFRDPFVFQSPRLESLLSNSTNLTNATGKWFLTISGGVRTDADPTGGGRLFLYRLSSNGDWRTWTFLGPIFGTAAFSSWSDWSGSKCPIPA